MSPVKAWDLWLVLLLLNLGKTQAILKLLHGFALWILDVMVQGMTNNIADIFGRSLATSDQVLISVDFVIPVLIGPLKGRSGLSIVRHFFSVWILISSICYEAC